jgi:hypothetical protein
MEKRTPTLSSGCEKAQGAAVDRPAQLGQPLVHCGDFRQKRGLFQAGVVAQPVHQKPAGPAQGEKHRDPPEVPAGDGQENGRPRRR